MPEMSTNYLLENNNSYKFLVVDIRIIKNLDIAIIIIMNTVTTEYICILIILYNGEALAHMF